MALFQFENTGFGRRCLRGCAVGCGGLMLICAAAIGLLFLFLNKVPRSYPLAERPIPISGAGTNGGGGLAGFDSPYLGHTGSWDGKGGAMFGGSKLGDLDKEKAMGLRWTFMPVHWRAMEPDGPVDLTQETPPAWLELDAFVAAAQARGLNILMQAPVVGGNAGGPPKWAGRREKGKSAPADMEALAAFAGKLADRYRPGGVLAQSKGWGDRYGVRAWEMDNEPEGYFTSWKGQAADYAEFVTLATRRIRASDPQAVIVAPGLGAGKNGLRWLSEALDPAAMAGSPAFRANAKAYSLGSTIDVVSFHNYEGLDSAFTGDPRTIGQVFEDVRALFEQAEQRSPGLTWERKRDYWHTEGNFDFIGALSAERRAAWRLQFFTRAFACGIRKVCVMDASAPEQMAVHAYLSVLPDPYPMVASASEIAIRKGKVDCFLHRDGPGPEDGQIWVIWPLAGTGDATVEVPVRRPTAVTVAITGIREMVSATKGKITLNLIGDAKMAAPFLIVDRQPNLISGQGNP
jgi:hypothetical protein